MPVATVNDHAILAGVGSTSRPPPSVIGLFVKTGAAGSYLSVPGRSRDQRALTLPPGLATSTLIVTVSPTVSATGSVWLSTLTVVTAWAGEARVRRPAA